ncbi:DUF3696 domain-containing protein [Escherichia coli]|uniref:DUF3696 domain-containing protein n=1 Tax=Enterobacteriaceae TaxID=543 RepID=UPI0007354059|nr:DUF3696 domain-containing protein [Enterobacter hormaechei]ECC9614167.1 DUF3696 domain-containing protein [Salmonella enterica subsp. enterica]EGA8861369.1 DUF3696 domain-containing protein [Salmonella enterica subsp. enterica serovar Orion]EHC0463353.1 DUF3696 domain-containing protein [Salmonella enterica]ELO1872319.1 DUF3696 domain-containing protein [Escherichia coli]EGH2525204.1 DUF3696 domain-containing protein [Salmonella enterica subsp. enterica serovar Orion]
MNQIKSIKLENFKSYKNQTFNISGLNVFCGNNSVGKSTVMQAIAMILQSDFGNKSDLKLNGDLINIGRIDDIFNDFTSAEGKLSITISTSNCEVRWGITKEDSTIIRNELPCISGLEDIKTLKDFINISNFQYIEAERIGPRDNIPLSQHNFHSDWLGKKGEYVIEVLDTIMNKQDRLILDNEKPNKDDPRIHHKLNSVRVASNIQAWMDEISPNYKIHPKLEVNANIAYNTIQAESGKQTKPKNIGFGYSYALSIVSALLLAKPGELVVLENPEAHLHPRGQSYMGRLIAYTAQAGVQVLIETHSDHLLNGIRVVARTSPDFSPELISLFYISHENNESTAEKIAIGKDGKLSSWPKGFFDQQSIDMYTIMTGSFDTPDSMK